MWPSMGLDWCVRSRRARGRQGTKTQWRVRRFGAASCLCVSALHSSAVTERVQESVHQCVCKCVRWRTGVCCKTGDLLLILFLLHPAKEQLRGGGEGGGGGRGICVERWGGGQSAGGEEVMTRWKGPGEEETQELTPPSLCICDVVCVYCVCGRESETGLSVDSEPAQEEEAPL